MRADGDTRRSLCAGPHANGDLVVASVSPVSGSDSLFTFFFPAAASSPTRIGHPGESFISASGRDGPTSMIGRRLFKSMHIVAELE